VFYPVSAPHGRGSNRGKQLLRYGNHIEPYGKAVAVGHIYSDIMKFFAGGPEDGVLPKKELSG
jgi:hypothetical protein